MYNHRDGGVRGNADRDRRRATASACAPTVQTAPHRSADPGVRSDAITTCPDLKLTWRTPIDHPLDADGHGGVTFGKGEFQILVAVYNRPEAGAPLPAQYETCCGLLRLTVKR